MRTSRIGQLLLVVGGAVGVAAVVGLVLGFEPAKLPAALLNIAMYKLTFAAAAGLLAAGAIVRRYARGGEQTSDHGAESPGTSDRPPKEIGEGAAGDRFAPPREAHTRADARKPK